MPSWRGNGSGEWLRETKNCTIYDGHGRFTSPREVRVGDEVLTAERFFIDVGGRAATPPLSGLDRVDYLTNSTILELDVLPQHLMVVGGSYIGLEFAQMFRRFGSDVTVIEMGPRLIAREDEDVSAAILEILRNEGVQVRLDAKCIAVGRKGDRITATSTARTARPTSKEATFCWRSAVGPIRMTSVWTRPVLSWTSAATFRSTMSCAPTWPASGRSATATVAAPSRTPPTTTSRSSRRTCSTTARAVSATAYRPTLSTSIRRSVAPASPTPRYAKRGRPALVGQRPMTSVGRAVEKGEAQGFMKVTVDAESREILGAAVLGPGGDEAIHCILDVMYAKVPYTVLQRAMHIHPTVSELIPTILGELKPLA